MAPSHTMVIMLIEIVDKTGRMCRGDSALTGTVQFNPRPSPLDPFACESEATVGATGAGCDSWLGGGWVLLVPRLRDAALDRRKIFEISDLIAEIFCGWEYCKNNRIENHIAK